MSSFFFSLLNSTSDNTHVYVHTFIRMNILLTAENNRKKTCVSATKSCNDAIHLNVPHVPYGIPSIINHINLGETRIANNCLRGCFIFMSSILKTLLTSALLYT